MCGPLLSRNLLLFLILIIGKSLPATASMVPSAVLMGLKDCGALIRNQGSLSLQSLTEIPPQQTRRFAGVLAQSSGGTPIFYITPYLSAEAHGSIITKIIMEKGMFYSLWLGELEYTNLSLDPLKPQIVLRAACETAGQWGSWVRQQQGITPKEVSKLPAGARHENSVLRLKAELTRYFPEMLDEKSRFITWQETNPNAPHLDPDLNQIVKFFRNEKQDKGFKDLEVNVNHDIRSPMGVITQAITLYYLVQPSDRETLFTMMTEAKPPVSHYLDVIQFQYPDDNLLRMARQTLAQIGVRPLTEWRDKQQMDRLANLKEVIEFLMETDLSAVTQIPLLEISK